MTAYATVDDMVSRFGHDEVLRFSGGDGPLPETIIPDRIEQALTDASTRIDTYLRRRYTVPLAAPVPAMIVRAACTLARYDLAMGGDREPTEQMRLAMKDLIGWLEKIAGGSVTLEGAAPIAPSSGARSSDRDATFTSRAGGGL